MCNRILLSTFILLMSAICANAQLTQLLDDFNRSSSATVGTPTLGAPAWTEVETGTTTSLGCNITSNYLRLSSTTTAGREYVWRDCSSNYNTVLASNPSRLLWEFKMRQTRSDPSGFANNAWGMAVILGSTSSGFHNAGNGYAVVLGTPSTSTDPIRLVKFTGGFSTDGNLTNLISYSDFSDEYLAIKVYYTPSTNLWELYVDDDDEDFGAVSYNNAIFRGSATDGTYTSQDLRYVGALYNHPNTINDNGSLDEIYLPYIIVPAYYYSKLTGDLNLTSTWGKNLDGSGASPSNFTTAGQFFNIRNNLTPTISAAWTVSGSTSNVILGDSVSNIVFTVPSAFAYTGPIDISSFSKIVLQNLNVPTFGLIGIPSTVEYASASTQTISPTIYWDLVCTSTGGRTWASGTTGILDTFIVGANAFNNGSGTVDFMGAQPQFVPAIKYTSITNSGGGDRVLAPSGTIEISAAMTVSIGLYTITGSTVKFTSSTDRTIPILYVVSGPNYNNVIIAGIANFALEGPMTFGGDLTITSGQFRQNTGTTIFPFTINGNLNINGGDYNFSTGTGANVLTLKGNLSQTSGKTRVTGSVLGRITFAGSALQTVTAQDSIRFESCIFTIASGAYVKLGQNLSLHRNTTALLTGTMNVLSGGTLDCSTFRISAGIGSTGNVVFNLNSGGTLVTANPKGVFGTEEAISSINTVATFNSGANYKFNGAILQVPGLSNTTMHNLTIDNTANVTLTANINANGIITFINGKFNTTASFKIILGSGGSVVGAGTGKYVNGTFEKFIASGTIGKTFEIGEASSYDPVDLVFPAASNNSGSITAIVHTGDHPFMPGSGIDPTKTVNRYWTLTNNGVNGILPYSAEFSFVNPNDMDPGANPLAFVVRNYTSFSWFATTTGNVNINKTQAVSLSDFGDFEIGEHFTSATIACPVVPPVIAVSGCSAIVNFTATATGNPTPAIFYSHSPGTFFNVGTTPVIVTVVNINGSTNCTFNVIVNDITNPVLNNCPTDISTFTASGTCENLVTWIPPSASDNCSAIVTSNYNSGSFFPVGTTLVTYTATDPSGNTATCSFNVIVTDDEFPVLSGCPSDTIVNTDGGCGRIINWIEPTATDNCLFNFTSNHTPGDLFPIGTTTVIYTAKDSSHNETICSFNVILKDLELPVITCPADTAVTTDFGLCGTKVNFIVGATDNCAVTFVSIPPSGSIFPVGTTLVSSIATDASGNTSSCSFNVTVTDNENPHISCPADIIVNTDPSACGTNINFNVSTNDNCSANVVSTPASGSFFPVGTTTVNSVTTDASGNTATCSFKVTVINETSYSITSCDIYFFPWGGSTTSSGDFSYTYVAALGCDSVVKAHVIINHVDDQNVCTIDACNTLDGSVSHTPLNVDDGNLCTNDGCDPITGPFHITNGIVNDNNLCTTDGCNSLTGVFHIPVNFDDNNVCTTDACDPIIGQSHIALNINDNDSCTVDACDPITGITHNPVNKDDNNLCTLDGCDPGFGVFHVPISPDDGDPCTTDVCDPATGNFSHTAINTDDNNVCTVDGCDPVTGEFHNPVIKDDSNGCTIDICDPFFGIFNIPYNTDDGDLCTTDACDPSTGTISHTPVNTDDNNVCTTDACDPVTGTSHTAISIDDNNACTTDACDPITGPSHTAISINDSNVCTTDACDPVTGTSHTAISIDDGNVCTTDACDPITGPSHTLINIDDGNACTTDACDPVTGVSHTLISIDDNDVCTTDACDPVSGVSHTPISINDNNACTSDACDPLTGTSHTAISVDDSNVCTTDACDPLTGPSHTAISVDDSNVCTTDACDPLTGTSHTLINIDDNNACTTDACDPITGQSHIAVNINDSDSCTVDACDPITGITHNPVNKDDGNLCTLDGCDPDLGVFHIPVNTDDGNVCTADGCNSVTGIFHTQICTVTLNSKIFIQGFYSGGGLMQKGGTGCLNVTGFSPDPLDADTIILSAMDSLTHLEVDRKYGILKTNGDVSVIFSPTVLIGTSYYIKINHRNSLETWSALPVLFTSTTTYLFSTNASMAFGNNMIETPDNLGWAIYNGDLNQDGSVDGVDFLILGPSIDIGDGGYFVGDINGDGSVDGLDFLILDQNIQIGVGAVIP